MSSVTIEAAFRTRVLAVLDRSLRVASRAIGRDDRRRLVHAVAFGAVDRRMLRDGRRLAVPLGVAPDARGRGMIRGEGVTGQTSRGFASGASAVSDLRLLGVAVLANTRSGVLETFMLEIVACSAIDVEAAHVLSVTGTGPVLGPCGGHETGGHVGR